MHGTVTHAMREMIQSTHGHDVWAKACSWSGLDADTVILASRNYPDALMHQVASGACAVLEKQPEELLREFGRYWILEVTANRYGGLLEMCGSTFREFMLHLPEFHDRVMLLYPEIRAPEFSSLELDNEDFKVLYRSHRDGMQPFVQGILEGICRRFGVEKTVTIRSRRGDERDADVFMIEQA